MFRHPHVPPKLKPGHDNCPDQYNRKKAKPRQADEEGFEPSHWFFSSKFLIFFKFQMRIQVFKFFRQLNFYQFIVRFLRGVRPNHQQVVPLFSQSFFEPVHGFIGMGVEILMTEKAKSGGILHVEPHAFHPPSVVMGALDPA